MKPPIQYFGAKGSVAETLVQFMPEHEGYVEPYAGSLAVLLAKSPTSVEVVNDIDQRLMTFWRVLRDRPEQLLWLAECTPHARAEVASAQELDADDELQLAHQVWVMLTQGRSRTLQRSGWRFFADGGSRKSGAAFSKYMSAYRERLLPAAERLRNVSLECRPALDVIERYGEHEGNLLYVDPPYLHGTRQGGRYTHEMSKADHRDLADALKRCAGPVMLSGYPSPLYEELYTGWHRLVIRAHSGNAKQKHRDEIVWSNRVLDTPLFDLDAPLMDDNALAAEGQPVVDAESRDEMSQA